MDKDLETAGRGAEGRFDRTERIVGADGMARLAAARVIVFGVGGVGGWCAEALVRSGVGHVTLVDFDRVNVTNINRQVMASVGTVGERKVDALRDRLLDINPAADIRAVAEAYTEATADGFAFDDYDYVIDAIDSIADKALLILNATASRAALFSSMGAARRWDPLRVAVAEFWKVQGCPLARALRHRFKHTATRPARRFQCVYSPEMPQSCGEERGAGGSLVHVTAVFGFTLAGLVLRDIVAK